MLKGMLESAMDGIITVDQQQRIVLYNGAAAKIFGWPAAQVLGQRLEMLIPERFHATHHHHVERFTEKGVTSRRMGDGTVIHGRRADGQEFPLDASISHLDTPQGKLSTVILRDVTERVRAQQELAEFAAAASAIREQEKTRVARELHDELAQSLTAIKMDTIWLRGNVQGLDAAAAQRFEGMLAMIDASVAATRRIAADLRPLVLDDLGLAPAIEWLAGNFTQRHGVPCSLEIDESMEMDEPYATAVFRIVQESLANVAKHAGAARVEVGVVRDSTHIRLWVKDDGKGFDTGLPRRQESLGIVGLRERASQLNGSVSIDSAPGRGTRVDVVIPLARASAANAAGTTREGST